MAAFSLLPSSCKKVLVFLLAMTVLPILPIASSKSVKEAMKEYIEAVRNKKESKIIHFFPKNPPALVLIYTQGNLSNPNFQWRIDQQKIEKDFKSKGPLFHLFFDETKKTNRSFYKTKMEGPTYNELFDTAHAEALSYRDLLKKEAKGKWKKKDKSFFLQSPKVCDYVRWKKKGGKWILEEVAITAP
ncbi:hypothetical protein A946_00495 [Methylacidiphilum kamchatkense Kam1]|nr:hypothetical protein A946_00495 [Methylacidiphilum kamchatkense Kam1]